MKELSTQEKAKRYDVVVNEIKNLRDTLLKEGVINENGIICDNFNRIFPELKESEGEKVRESIIELVKQSSEILDKKNQERILAWLKKQGEQKPADKVEPKFKVGDIIKDTEDGEVFTIRTITKDKYIYTDDSFDWIKDQDVYELVEQKPAWSEEDDYNAERLLCLLTNEQDNYPQSSCDFQYIEGIKDWLKSLKDRYTWKPSDEQMKALKKVILCGTSVVECGELNNLYEDLGKLKGEQL